MFWFFLIVSCAFAVWPVCVCMRLICCTLCSPKTSLNDLWYACDDHTILVLISPPPRDCTKYTVLNHYSLFLPRFVFATWQYTPLQVTMQTHLHPPDSLLTPLCLHTNICIFLGNFPTIHDRESYPVGPFMFLLSYFLVHLYQYTPTHPYKCIYTHKHTYIRVRTLDCHGIYVFM